MNRCTATPQCADRRSGWPARGCCRPTAGPCSAAPAPATRAGPAAGRTGSRPPAPSGARENRPTPALSGSLNSWSSILDHRGHVEQRRIDRRHRGTALLVITSYSEIIDLASGPLRVGRQPTTRTLSISLDVISAQLPRCDLRRTSATHTPTTWVAHRILGPTSDRTTRGIAVSHTCPAYPLRGIPATKALCTKQFGWPAGGVRHLPSVPPRPAASIRHGHGSATVPGRTNHPKSPPNAVVCTRVSPPRPVRAGHPHRGPAHTASKPTIGINDCIT